MSVSVSFKTKSAAEISAKRGLDPGGRVQKFIDNEVLKHCAPRVPHQMGVLQGSGASATTLGSGEVRYATPYARRLYYNPQYTFNGAPMRGGKWFDRMKNAHKQEILAGAAKIAGGHT